MESLAFFTPELKILWLVVEPPLWKNMSSSVGVNLFPTYGKNKKNQNHQPVMKVHPSLWHFIAVLTKSIGSTVDSQASQPMRMD